MKKSIRSVWVVLAIAALAGCDWPPRDHTASGTPAPRTSWTRETIEAELASRPPQPLPPQAAAAAARIHALLAAPPLRPLPATLPTLALAHEVGDLEFATAAGIVLVGRRGEKGYSVVDLGSGEVLATGGDITATSLSANGRLLAAGRDEGSEVRDVVSGEVLLTLPATRPWQVFWIDDAGVVIAVPDSTLPLRSRLVYRDLVHGLDSTLAIVASEADLVVPVPRQRDRWLVMAGGDLHEILLEDTPQGRVARVVAHGDWDGSTHRGNRDLLGGRYHVDARGDEVVVVDAAERKQRIDRFEGYRMSGQLPTADPDALLVYASRPGTTGGYYRYSLSRRDLLPLPPGALPSRLFYVPSLRVNAVVDGTTLAPFALPTGAAPATAGDVPAPTPPRGRQATSADPADVAVDPAFAALADGAHVVALGVHRAKAEDGSVRVQVLRTRGPVVLVLTSYKPVRWVLSIAPDADVRGVLVGGPFTSEVIGTHVPVRQVGHVYATAPDDPGPVAALDRVVRRWTGKGLASLEGAHSTDSFTILE